jgi:hypothetical protein
VDLPQKGVGFPEEGKRRAKQMVEILRKPFHRNMTLPSSVEQRSKARPAGLEPATPGSEGRSAKVWVETLDKRQTLWWKGLGIIPEFGVSLLTFQILWQITPKANRFRAIVC